MKLVSTLSMVALLLAIVSCTSKKEVNILSYNTHNCIGLDGRRDCARVADVIRRVAPDVVALQELDSATERSQGMYVLGELARETGLHAVYAAAIPYQGGSYGIGILSREVPLACKTVAMPGREEARTLLVAEYKDFVFCATHQSLTPEDQLLSVPLIKETLQGVDKPVFLAGDMNSLPTDRVQQELGEAFVTLNDTGLCTYPADCPDSCLDYIYAYKENGYRFQVRSCEVLEETVASDHRPVRVSVEFSR